MKKTWSFSILVLVFSLGIYAGFYGSIFLRMSMSNTPTQKECTSLGFRDMSWWAWKDRVIINSPDSKYHGLVGELRDWKENANLWSVFLYDKSGSLQCLILKPSQICNLSHSEKMPAEG